jgi:uncharacterized cupin superfamily protein
MQQPASYKIAQLGPLNTLTTHTFRGQSGKVFLGEILGLTGCEVSVNVMVAGQAMPFVHAHRQNEEVYIILRGSGFFFLDGEEFPVAEGSVIRVNPPVARSWRAGKADMHFLCIQGKQGAMHERTVSDGFLVPTKAPWMVNP